MTTITIVGNVTRALELRYTQGGKAVTNIGIAVNERVKDGNDWIDGDPTFFDVTLWDTLAENAADSLDKGDRVIVTGRMKAETWEKDGETRTKMVVTADDIAPSLKWSTAVPQKVRKDDRPAVDNPFG